MLLPASLTFNPDTSVISSIPSSGAGTTLLFVVTGMGPAGTDVIKESVDLEFFKDPARQLVSRFSQAKVATQICLALTDFKGSVRRNSFPRSVSVASLIVICSFDGIRPKRLR